MNLLPQPRSAGSTEAIKRAVAAGIGVAIVSRLTLELELQAKPLVVLPLRDLTMQRSLHLIRQRGREDTHAARAFLKRLLP